MKPSRTLEPSFQVRISGQVHPAQTTRIRRGLSGGAFKGGRDVEFGAVTVRDVSFADLTFDHFYADGTTFENCDFSRTIINGTFGVRHQTVFDRCAFENTLLREVEPGQAQFARCAFHAADMKGWNAAANEFVDCEFVGPVRHCNFWGRPSREWLERGLRRHVNEFVGNDFVRASLFDVSFLGGIDLSKQRLPATGEYARIDRPTERFHRARPVIETWPAAERSEARVMLEVFTSAGFEDQAELFAHRWDLDVPRSVADRVWALVESDSQAKARID